MNINSGGSGGGKAITKRTAAFSYFGGGRCIPHINMGLSISGSTASISGTLTWLDSGAAATVIYCVYSPNTWTVHNNMGGLSFNTNSESFVGLYIQDLAYNTSTFEITFTIVLLTVT